MAFGILNKQKSLNVYIYCHGNLVDVDLYLSDTIDIRGKRYVGSIEAAKQKTAEIHLDRELTLKDKTPSDKTSSDKTSSD